MVAYLLAKNMKATYCDTWNPTEPNDKVPEPSVTNAVPFDPSDVGNV